MNIHDVYSIFVKRFRPKRAIFIRSQFPLLFNPECNVLDLGGGLYPWSMLQPKAHIKILNLKLPTNPHADCKLSFFIGDATKLEYKDKSFDLVFSNSVIEHIGDWQAQQAFASEMLHVGKKKYFQTPNKWFPFSVTRRLICYLGIWGLVNKPTQKVIDDFWSSTCLLSRSEVRALFPDFEIQSERVLGLTKSFIVVG